jgi:hypothetical protein
VGGDAAAHDFDDVLETVDIKHGDASGCVTLNAQQFIVRHLDHESGGLAMQIDLERWRRLREAAADANAGFDAPSFPMSKPLPAAPREPEKNWRASRRQALSAMSAGRWGARVP